MAQTIENWEFFERDVPPTQGRYGAPELWKKVFLFKGLVNGTQMELPIDRKGKGKFVSGETEYELGEPHPNYEAAFPGAKARVLSALV